MCYNTTGIAGNISTWTNRIYYDSFQTQDWLRTFTVDTWNNSMFCCTDPLVSPTYNSYDNIIPLGDLTLRVTPIQSEKIIAYSSSISTYRDDIQYGSFRISAKMSELNGTSFGFFFFYSITEEIDVEMLSHEGDSGKVRVSIQPIVRDNSGRASNISQKVIDLKKNLSIDFVEYRFDWFKTRVDFFADGVYYHSLHVHIPTHHGKIVINHRTNGNPKWSRGPPVTQSDAKINYIDLYFNSSESDLCKNLNDYESLNTNENWKRYISSIIVASLFLFVICVASFVSIYRKILPSRPSSILETNIEQMISARRP
jgi:hypothetical protein